MALSASVSFARFLEPMVKVGEVVTVARLFRISTSASRVNFVEAEISNDTFVPCMWMDSKFEQLLNIYPISVTLLVSIEGIDVSELQAPNILLISVTLLVSIDGIDVSELQAPNIVLIFVTLLVSIEGIDVSELQ